jgi:hypothetical protein
MTKLTETIISSIGQCSVHGKEFNSGTEAHLAALKTRRAFIIEYQPTFDSGRKLFGADGEFLGWVSA